MYTKQHVEIRLKFLRVFYWHLNNWLGGGVQQIIPTKPGSVRLQIRRVSNYDKCFLSFLICSNFMYFVLYAVDTTCCYSLDSNRNIIVSRLILHRKHLLFIIYS